MPSLPPAAARRCPPESLKAALRVLHDGVPEAERAGLIAAIRGASQDNLAGLFVVGGDAQPDAAAWVQPVAGDMAVVWPPDGASPHAADVLRAAARFIDERQIGVAQTVVPLPDELLGAALSAAGFPQLAELAYLFADALSDGGAHVAEQAFGDNGLTFDSRAGEDPQRLGRLLRRTYVDSCDVPQLDGSRSADDVLAGYRAQGEHLPDHWYRIACDGVDAAVLLLAAHADYGNWELVYVGVAPEFRGRGLGIRIVQRARALAAAGGAERLVLAVDAANAPGLAMYEAAGFTQWDRRRVYARLRTADATARNTAG